MNGLTVGLFIAVVPVLLILLVWLLPRLRFARRATEAKRLLSMPGGAELLALRALSTYKLADLAEISPEVASLWRGGYPAIVAKLAQLQLRSLGIRSALVEQ